MKLKPLGDKVVVEALEHELKILKNEIHNTLLEIREQILPAQGCRVVATGGFARLFERDPIFDIVVTELPLVGLKRALSLNPEGSTVWAESGGDTARRASD